MKWLPLPIDRLFAIVLLALAQTACLPIIGRAGYEDSSRRNVADAVPAFITAGQTSLTDVMLALGEPDFVAADGSRVTYISRYGKGERGVMMIVPAGYAVGALGASTERFLLRRLRVSIDAQGIVTAAEAGVFDCHQLGGTFMTSETSSSKCRDQSGHEFAVGE